MFSKPTHLAAARCLATLFLLCAATLSSVAQTLSFPRLLLGVGGPTNRVFTAGDVVTPFAQLDTNVYYKVIVRDGAGNILNPAFPCVAGTAFASTNSYVVQPSAPPSTNAPYTFVIEEFANGACSGAPMASATQQFYVVSTTAYTNAVLTAVTNRFTTTQTAYVRVDGLPPNTTNWNATWILPNGSTSCVNNANSDRPDAGADGRLSSSYLAYPPNDAFSNNWNDASSYETSCSGFSTGNQGQWQLKLQLNSTSFVTLRAFVMSNDCFAPTVSITDRTVCAGSSTTFTAATNGTGPFTFAWRKDGVVIPVTSRSFTISPVNVSTAGVYTVEVTGPCGKATNSATLTVNTLVSGQALPDQSVCAGETVIFLAVTNGTGPFTFQWRKGTTNISGATAAAFTISSPVPTNSGNYNVIISGQCNSVTNSGKLTVYPSLTLSPLTNAVRYVGTVVSFSTTPSGGNGTNIYSWWKNGAVIPGQTNRTLTLTNLSVGDGGTYTVIANSSCSATQSATLLIAHCFESLDVMLVIDRSGSMVGQPYTDARTAATNFIRNLVLSTNSDVVGLVSFNPVATLNQTLTNSAPALEQAVHTLGPATNGTCVSCGITTAQAELNSIRHRSGALPVMLILSDGVPHDFDTPSNALYNATEAKLAGTRVFTVGLNDGSGTNVDVTLLSTMSSSSNDFFYANSSSELASIFDEISALLCRGPNDIMGPTPSNVTVCAGANVEFNVSASGCAIFTFQWSKQGTSLPGQTNSTLYLPNVTASDAGVYDVIISSFCGTITNSATLTINTPAQLIFGPMSQTRCAGGNVSFSVNAAGSGLTYQWLRNSTPLPGKTNALLTLTDVMAGDAGVYSAVVSSPCSAIPISTSAQLFVNTPPVLTSIPDVAACPNEIVTLQTTASGAGPFSYVWRRNGSVISGATTNRLTLAPANATSVATYTVEVTGLCGAATNSASLILLTNTTATPLTSLTRCVGEVASFATVPGGSGPFTFVWRKDGAVIPGQASSSLILTDVALTNAGTYSVEVRGACHAVTNSASLFLKQPTTTSPLVNATICPGEVASFSTLAQGTGPFSFVWRKDGVVINDATNATLTIFNATVGDSATYAVEVTGMCNSVTNSATLMVRALTTAAAFSNLTHCAGESATFATTPFGAGPFTFVWRKDGVVLAGETNAVFVRGAVTTNDAGVYSVEVSGACNTATNSATLVINKLTTLAPVNDTTACTGGAVTFAALPQGTGPFSFVWRRDGQILGTNSTLTLTNVSPAADGTYEVEVTGRCNTVTDSATLFVRGLTTATPIPDAVRCSGEDVTFSTVAGGPLPYYFLWRKNGVLIPGETNSFLSLTSVTTNDAGTYTMEAVGRCNTAIRSAVLVVHEAVAATALANVTRCTGETVTFVTTPSGTGPFTFAWRKDGVLLANETNASLMLMLTSNNDAGVFSIEVSGLCGSVTNSATLAVSGLIMVTPLTNQSHCFGENATFAAQANGSGPFIYVWRKDGALLSNITNDVLSLTNLTLSDAGIYSVEISSACGAVTNVASLAVNGPPSALVNQARCAGETAVFNTTISGSGPFAFAWRKDGTLLSEETNNILVLSNLTVESGGSYAVEVTAPCGHFTNSASLAVQQPTVATRMANQSRCAGATVSFITVASGSGPFTYVWRKNGVVMPGKTSFSITLGNITAADAAEYCVEVNGGCSSVTNCAALTVTTPATITALTNLSVCPGENAVFAPVISGNGTYTNLWRKNGAVMPGQTNGTLLISGVTFSNAGTYSLEVYGACGNTTNSASLSVRTNMTVASLADQAHCAGGTATFTANTSGTGPCTFVWRKNGDVVSNATASVLILTNISAADGGLYTVEVAGPCNTVTSSATLTVDQVTTATALQDLNVCSGQFAMFSTTAAGGGAPYVCVWRKDGLILTNQTNGTLIFTNVSPTNAGLYSVEVIGCNSVTNFASLTVVPFLTSTLATNFVVCTCDDLLLAPAISGAGPFTCAWRKDGVLLAGETNTSLSLHMLNTLSSGNYSFEIVGPCNGVTNNTYVKVLNVTSGRWSYTNSFLIPQLGPAYPYPSTTLVQCAPKNIRQLTVTLHQLSHEFPDDLDIMLVAPNGIAIKLMSDCGGTGANAISNVDLSFSAEAPAFLPDNAKIVTGLYRPTDHVNDIDPFQPPAPPSANTTNLSALYGTNPNGYWSLFVVDDHGEDAGSIAGWTLDFGDEDFTFNNVWLSTPEMLPNGAFQMQLNGVENKTYYVEASPNFINWTIIQTNKLPSPSMTIIDHTAPQFNYRFYRATGCSD